MNTPGQDLPGLLRALSDQKQCDEDGVRFPPGTNNEGGEMMDTILPCPFCGRPPNIIGVSKIWVQCVKPGCPIAGHNFMIAAWNERPQPSAPVQPLTECELAPWPSYKLLFSVVERGDIEAMAEVNPGIASLLTHFKDGISSHNELVAKLSASPSAQPQPEEVADKQEKERE